MNRYIYAYDNPLRYVDPTGHYGERNLDDEIPPPEPVGGTQQQTYDLGELLHNAPQLQEHVKTHEEYNEEYLDSLVEGGSSVGLEKGSHYANGLGYAQGLAKGAPITVRENQRNLGVIQAEEESKAATKPFEYGLALIHYGSARTAGNRAWCPHLERSGNFWRRASLDGIRGRPSQHCFRHRSAHAAFSYLSIRSFEHHRQSVVARSDSCIS